VNPNEPIERKNTTHDKDSLNYLNKMNKTEFKKLYSKLRLMRASHWSAIQQYNLSDQVIETYHEREQAFIASHPVLNRLFK
jgi:DnaJ-domain-containing protein 1